MVGKYVLKAGTTAVIDLLRKSGTLLFAEEFKHRYPYDWRAKQPVILRYVVKQFVFWLYI